MNRHRWLFLFGLLLVSCAALASNTNASFPALFKPAADDLSIWYLGNIFGSDLMGGLVETNKISGIRLMSVLFGIFNQIALVVGIIIIVYTVLAGTLNTAHEGKPLGEKWNSVWMPVRTSMGIALLVPKGGSGYCLAQSLIMWLAVQGIGAADQVWNAMIDYFAQGGAIYSNTGDQAASYMTQQNIAYTLKLQGDSKANMPTGIPGASPPSGDFSLLKSMICISTYNKILQETLSKNGESATGNTMYTAYTIAQDTTHVYFGDQAAGNARVQPGYTGSNTAGMECGAVVIVAPDCPMPDGKHNPNSKCGDEASREQIYTLANWNMAQGLQGIAKEISTNLDNDTNWETYYSTVFHNSELYINYLVGYQDFLFYNKKDELKTGDAFKQYKKYGWILAGNYYTILSSFKERVNFMTRKLVPPTSIAWLEVDGSSTMPVAQPGDQYDQAYTAEIDFWTSLESYINDPVKGGPHYDEYIAAYGEGAGKKAENISGSGNKIGPVDMNKLLATISGTSGTNNLKGHGGNKKKRGKGVVKGNASMATVSAVQNYIQYLTGANSRTGDFRVAQDPILRASEYGKGLTSAAIPMMATAVMIQMLAASFHICDAESPGGSLADATVKYVVWGLIALGMFMYTQGAILGVFIPLIPYVTFFIGVVGWLLQVVEAIAAAPLVAIGLIFPETRDDIWGRAAPAYMMILALFLRPPLMLVGFAAAMIVLWCLTELLNIGFLTLTAVTFRIEDMFGFVTIMTAYTAVFTVVVTRSYELINVVPNKVLNWIGGPGMEVQGAQEALGAAKGGVQEGAGAVAAGAKGGADTVGGGYEKAERGEGGKGGNLEKREKAKEAELGPGKK